MRVLFAASRHAGPEHRQVISDALLSVVICAKDPGPHVLIHGAGRGGDKLAEGLAQQWLWTILAYPADWQKHGKAAGPVRNELMVRTAHADRVLAMPDIRDGLDGGGTAGLAKLAAKAGLPVDVRPLRIEEATLL